MTEYQCFKCKGIKRLPLHRIHEIPTGLLRYWCQCGSMDDVLSFLRDWSTYALLLALGEQEQHRVLIEHTMHRVSEHLRWPINQDRDLLSQVKEFAEREGTEVDRIITVASDAAWVVFSNPSGCTPIVVKDDHLQVADSFDLGWHENVLPSPYATEMTQIVLSGLIQPVIEGKDQNVRANESREEGRNWN